MSAKVIDFTTRMRATDPEPDISKAMTARQDARRFLLYAMEKLDVDDIESARIWVREAQRHLDRMVPGMSPEEEHADLVKRARRIARAHKGTETRHRNQERRAAALAAAGIVLTRDGVLLPALAGGAS